MQRGTRAVAMALSTYLRRAQEEPRLVADRAVMLGLYSTDMRHFAKTVQLTPARDHSCVRLVTWNVNCLRGADGNSAIDASEVAAVLKCLDADVLALQESPAEFDTSWGEWLVEPLERLRELDSLLEELGYTLLRSPATNPTLLATRLPISHTEGFPLDPHPIRSRNGNSIWSETRGCRYVELTLPDLQTLRVYATHLHHKDTEICSETDSAIPGVRRREVEKLVRHFEACGDKSIVAGTVLLADFNQPLQRHYSVGEWEVVAAGLNHPSVAQPYADGVVELLESKGFVCAYELARSKNNFDGRSAPPMTHWTGTTIDFAFANFPSTASVDGAYVHYSDLSDHAPIVVDVKWDRSADRAQGA